MFDDDDDGVEPQFKVVDKYYFEDDDGEDVCFSILPFQFDENDEVLGCALEKKVYLRGQADKMDEIYKRVEAWRVEFESEQPDILLLSEGKWIKLLQPRKVYAEKIFRSALITLQMLHFVRKHPRDMRNLCGSLFDHLNEVFSKFVSKPTVDDLRSQYSLIKLITEKDHVLMKSKILKRFLEDGFVKIEEPNSKTISTKVQFIVDDQSHETNYNDDGDYDDKECNNGDSDEDDDYSCHEDDSDDDASSDGHSDNDDGADPICAMCDDGGKLLSCKGQCKRAFHPTKKHGRKSECETLGYTSAQQKRIVTYICKNCKYKQHQCFKCGELEPSDGPNAKVFQCNNSSCGYFYHPKCIAQLLEPVSVGGACALEKKISARMSFPCPIHWCFKCKRMEDRTQEALQLATCRRCPRSYHRQCLPREISFEAKDQGARRCAWELPQIKFFYCPDHVDKSTKTVRRDHIKFPLIPKNCRTRDPAKKSVKMTGKRKSSTDQYSRRSRKLSNRATSTAEKETTSETSYDVSRKGAAPSTRSMFHHLVQHGLKDANGQSKNDKHTYPPSFSFRRCSDMVQEVMEKTGMHSDSCVEQNTSCVNQQQDIMQENPLLEKDDEWANENCRISGSVKTSEHHGSGKGQDKPHKDTSRGNGEQNDLFDSLSVERDTEEDGSNLQSGKVNGIEWEESACGHDLLSQQDGGTINLEVYNTHPCLANHKEPDVMETELNSPWYSDENRAASTSEDMSKERTDMRGNSYKRNAQEMPTNPSPELRTMDYCDSYSYPIPSFQYRYEQQCHVNCSCLDYFTCRKYMPLLDDLGNLKYGGHHGMNIDPIFPCSLQCNSSITFQPCTDVRVGGHGAVYGGCNSEFDMRSEDLFLWGPWAPPAMSVSDRYATHPEAHLAWRQTYNQQRGQPMLSHTYC